MFYNFELSDLRLTQSIGFEKQPYVSIWGSVDPIDLELLIGDDYALYSKNNKSNLAKKYPKKEFVRVMVCFLRDELVRKSVGNNIGEKEIVGVGFFHKEHWTTREPTIVLEILLSEENMEMLMSNILAKQNPTNLGITIINKPFELVELDYVWKATLNEKNSPTFSMLEIDAVTLTYSTYLK